MYPVSISYAIKIVASMANSSTHISTNYAIEQSVSSSPQSE